MRQKKSHSTTSRRSYVVLGWTFMSAAALATLLAAPNAASALPLKPAGNTANLVLVCRFKGDTGDTYNATSLTPSKTYWQSLTNAFNADDSTGEFKRYINAASNGKVSVDSVFPQDNNGTLDYLDIDMSESDYKGASTDTQLFESISKAFAAKYGSYDISKANIDTDSSTIDNVMIVMQTDSADSFTSHQGSGASAGSYKLNGVSIGSYEVIPSGRVGGLMGSLDAVPAHEYLHSYDATDLYRKGTAASTEKPATYWDIMASASQTLLPLAVTSQDMGFETIDTVDSGDVTLGTYGQSNHAVAFKSPLNDNEYFVAEYRQGDLTASNGYVADKRIGNKGGFDTSKSKDGVIVYRVDSRYGALNRGGDGTGNTVNDYIYIFRPNDTSKNHAGGDSLGNIESANLAAGKSIGTADMTKGIADGALCYSDGTNSGIVLKVVSAGDGAAKIQIEKPDYSSLGLWNAAIDGKATFVSDGMTSVQTAVAGNRIYAMSTGYNITRIYELKGNKWTFVNDFAMSDASMASDGSRLVIAGIDSNNYIHVEQFIDGNNNAMSDIGEYPIQSVHMSSNNWKLFLTCVDQDGTMARSYAFSDETRWIDTENRQLDVTGASMVDALTVDNDTLITTDFSTNETTVYKLNSNDDWEKKSSIVNSPRNATSGTYDAKTLVAVNSSNLGGQPTIYTLADGKLTKVDTDFFQKNDQATLVSDSNGFAITITRQENGVMTAIVYRSTDGETWEKSGEQVASSITAASNVSHYDGNDYCLTISDDMATLRTHSEPDSPAPEPKKTYTVRYDTGTNETIADSTVDEGDEINLPADPIRDGYRFLGWYDSKDGGNKISAGTKATSDITLYARWEKIIINRTITYDTNGGDTTIASKTVQDGDKIILPNSNPTRTGYKFLGWFDAKDNGNAITDDTIVNSDITLYAHWERIIPSYTVSYDTNGGNEHYSSVSIQEGAKIQFPESPTRDGYKFLGWYDSKDGGNEIAGSSVVTRDMVLYAHWAMDAVDDDCTITYDSNGGNETYQATTVKRNSVIDLPTPTREGYTFLGWYDAKDGGNRLTQGVSVIKNSMAVYAHWSKNIAGGGENTNTGNNTNTGASTNTGSNTSGNANGSANTDSTTRTGTGSTSPDDNLTGQTNGAANAKKDETNGIASDLQQTGVTISIAAIIGAAIAGAIALIVSTIRKRS